MTILQQAAMPTCYATGEGPAAAIIFRSRCELQAVDTCATIDSSGKQGSPGARVTQFLGTCCVLKGYFEQQEPVWHLPLDIAR